MSGRTLQSVDSIAQRFVTKALFKFQYVFLWLLLRVSGNAAMHRVSPYALAISSMAYVVSVAVSYGCVLLFIHEKHWAIVCLIMVAALMARLRGAASFCIFIAALLVFPLADASLGFRWTMIAINLVFAKLHRSEFEKGWAQFGFKPFYLSNIDQGSARLLRGKVHVMHFFVHYETAWTVDEMMAAKATATEALDWLVDQAKRYNVRVRFKQASMPESHAVLAPQSRGEEKDHQEFSSWLRRLAETQFPDFTHSNRLAIVHLNFPLDECLGYAAPSHLNYDGIDKLEYTVVGTPHDPRVYAHEVLHLFGADDMYMAAYDHEETHLRKQLMRNCIMSTWSKETLFSTSLVVDDLTAQNIGWM